MAAPDLADSLLDRQGEEEWQRLRRHLELAEGFWLGFLFTPSPRTAAVFRERTERFLRGRVRALRVFRPETPEALRSLLPSLFDAESEAAGGVWIEAIRSDSSGKTGSNPGAWTLAWDELLLRLNERRERLRRHLSGGLVLAAPHGTKIRVRDAAPDLWSIRSIVLEPPPVPMDRPLNEPEAEISEAIELKGQGHPGRRPDARLNLPPSADPAGDAAALLREAEGLITLGESGQAIEKATEAVERLREAGKAEGPLDLAAGLAILARAEETDGDLAGAFEHLDVAIRLRETSPSREVMLWLDRLRDLAKQAGYSAQALRAIEMLVELGHRFSKELGDAPEALRDLSISLDRLGDAQKEAGDLPAASDAFHKSLDIRQRLREQLGDSPEVLRDLAICFDRLGEVQQEAGDLPAASDAFQQSLEIRQRLREQLGDSPQVLRDLSVSLNNLGDVRQEAGDLAAALGAFQQSLEIAQRLRDQLGDSRQVLRDLSVSLNNLGDVRQEAGDLAAAMDAFQESLDIRQSLREQLGDSPQVLRDLSISLERLGDVRHEAGDLPAASDAFQQSLAIRQRLREQLGDSPQVLRDLSISLDRIGDVYLAKGNLEEATKAYRDAVALDQRRLDTYGDSPRILEDLEYSRAKLASLKQQSRS